MFALLEHQFKNNFIKKDRIQFAIFLFCKNLIRMNIYNLCILIMKLVKKVYEDINIDYKLHKTKECLIINEY